MSDELELIRRRRARRRGEAPPITPLETTRYVAIAKALGLEIPEQRDRLESLVRCMRQLHKLIQKQERLAPAILRVLYG